MNPLAVLPFRQWVYAGAAVAVLAGAGGAAYWWQARNEALVALGVQREQLRQVSGELVVAQAATVGAERARRAAAAQADTIARSADSLRQQVRRRLALVADTVRVPVVEVRQVLEQVLVADSAALALEHAARIASDSAASAWERRALLAERKSEIVRPSAPVVIHQPTRAHVWRDRAEHGAVLVLGVLVARERRGGGA